MAYERESRTLVVDGRLVNVNGAGKWDHRVDPLNCARTPETILSSELGERGAAFRVDMQPSGTCTLTSAPKGAGLQFDNLAAALASARMEAADAEADIEIWMDGFYVFVHQPQGWPRRIVH